MQTKKLRGFVFSFEALIVLIVFILVIHLIPVREQIDLKELILIQGGNDLLRVWSQKYPTQSEMISDTTKLFGENTSITINHKEIKKCEAKTNNAVAVTGVIVDEWLVENEVIITICY